MNKARSLKQKPAPQAQKEGYRPKSEVLRRRLSERGTRIIDLPGHYEKWTPEELAMIGTLPDREVAHRIGRSLSAVRRKRAALRDG